MDETSAFVEDGKMEREPQRANWHAKPRRFTSTRELRHFALWSLIPQLSTPVEAEQVAATIAIPFATHGLGRACSWRRCRRGGR